MANQPQIEVGRIADDLKHNDVIVVAANKHISRAINLGKGGGRRIVQTGLGSADQVARLELIIAARVAHGQLTSAIQGPKRHTIVCTTGNHKGVAVAVGKAFQ